MSAHPIVVTLSPSEYEAVLFDLDGVLTRTAEVHAAAWKRLFDEFLAARAKQSGEPFVPFGVQADYRLYVDGKPRREGVEAFLAARGIALPAGDSTDAAGQPTLEALARRKDDYFKQHLKDEGVAVFESSIQFVRALRAQGVKTAVVSSSNNCAAVLEAAHIADLFDVRVDGLDLARHALRGKPAPDMFLAAAARLRVDPSSAAVIEDALVGVAAGRAGRFRFVLGVDRLDQRSALLDAGADAVVTDLAQVEVRRDEAPQWSLLYESFDPAAEGRREALCALGNGYFTTRGAACWAEADGVHYPGTYLAGGYNRLTTSIAGREVENESLVNLPNWLTLQFRFAGGEWFDERRVRLLEYRQRLDLRAGLLRRKLRFEDAQGRRSTLEERRLVSMHDMHLCAIELRLRAENWSGWVELRSAIEGRVVNAGARLYRPFHNRHLEPLAADSCGDESVWLEVQTCQSRLRLSQAARTRLYLDDQPLPVQRRLLREPGYIAHALTLEIGAGRTLRVEKVATLFSSRDSAISESGLAARKALQRAGSFSEIRADHARAWLQLWRRFDLEPGLSARPATLQLPMLLRLNMLHLLQAVSPNSIGLDAGVPARGWTGEAYEGHVFWDELFIFPTLNYRMPELTRSLLLYRYRRLDEARQAARRAGFRGAMFPWQSGSDGQEETQDSNLNPRSQRWIKDNSYLQRHVGSAIAYNVWQYFQVTRDLEFMSAYGAELILEIARFWSSLASLEPERGRYEIRGVIGPDEFHDAYPGAAQPGLRNNAYTNVMAVCVLRYALATLELLPELRRDELCSRLSLSSEEIARWDEVGRKMFVPFHGDGIISQFEGYESLAELDWEGYRKRYGNIQRLELILEAEGDSVNRYQASKQADVLMLFYLFSSDELRELFAHLGYTFENEQIRRNVEYYDRRSSHGSTLSRVVHAWVLARLDRDRALHYFSAAVQSDVTDIQQGTTAEGVHLGAMAGSVDLVQRVSTGIEVRADVLRINPRLPPGVEQLSMRLRYRGHTLDLSLSADSLTIRDRDRGQPPIVLEWKGEQYSFAGGETRAFTIDPP